VVKTFTWLVTLSEKEYGTGNEKYYAGGGHIMTIF